MRKYLKWLGFASAFATLLACTSMQPLSTDPSQLREALKLGDEVEISTVSGQQLRFALERIDDSGLHGGGQNVSYSDIRSINRKQILSAKSSSTRGGYGMGGMGGGY